jgi:hypothetical protein
LIHDLNNAMAVISGRVELLLHSLHDRALLRHLMEAQHATLEACETIRHMHGFVSSGHEGGLGLVDINQLVRDSLQIVRSSWFQDFCQRRVPVDLREDLQPVPALSGRASDLRMALLCLLRHAMDTLRPGDSLMVRTSAVGEAAGRFVLVSLAADPYQPETVEHEDGIGILLRQTLTPESRLVLEFAQAIIYDLEGQITVDRSGDGATATTLTFPVGRTIAGVH